MLCVLCNEDIPQNDYLKCTTCKEFFHYACGGLREEKFCKLNKPNKDNWSCSNCKFKKKALVIADEIASSINTTINNTTVSDKTPRDVVNSLKFMSAQFDSFGQQLKDLISTVKILEDENNLIKEENMLRRGELSSLLGMVNMLEQKMLDCNQEIVGIPESKDENCTNTFLKSTSKLGINVSTKNIFQIPSNIMDKPRKLSVHCSSFDDKKKIMELVQKQNLIAKDLESNWKDSKIYFNDQLTSTNRNLFYKAITTTKGLEFKYFWFKNNTILLKKMIVDTSKAILIKDENSLSKLYLVILSFSFLFNLMSIIDIIEKYNNYNSKYYE